MVKTLFRTTQYEVSELLDELDRGVIVFSPGTPPFSWVKDDIKNLIHRMYKGLPIGRVVLRQLSREEKEERAEYRFAQWVVYDGLDQLRALQGAFRGTPIPFEAGEESLHLAFNPRLEMFDLPTTANSEHPDWFSEIKQLWDSHYQSVDSFLRRNESAYNRQLFEETKWDWRDRFDKIRDLRDFPVSVLLLQPEVEISDYEWRLAPKPETNRIPKPSDHKTVFGASRSNSSILEGAAGGSSDQGNPSVTPPDGVKESAAYDSESEAPVSSEQESSQETEDQPVTAFSGTFEGSVIEDEGDDVNEYAETPGYDDLDDEDGEYEDPDWADTEGTSAGFDSITSRARGVLRSSFDWLRSMPSEEELRELTGRSKPGKPKEQPDRVTSDNQEQQNQQNSGQSLGSEGHQYSADSRTQDAQDSFGSVDQETPAETPEKDHEFAGSRAQDRQEVYTLRDREGAPVSQGLHDPLATRGLHQDLAQQDPPDPQLHTVNIQAAAWGQYYEQMDEFIRRLENESKRRNSRIEGYEPLNIDDLALMAGLKALGITNIKEIKKRIGASADPRHDFSSKKKHRAAKAFQNALDQITDVNSWFHFIRVLKNSGYVTDRMHVDSVSMLYAYVFWLIAREEGKADRNLIDSTISRWFFMTQWKEEYINGTASIETELMLAIEESDLYASGICGVLNRTVDLSMPRDRERRDITDKAKRPLETSVLTMPFLASLNIRDAELLMSPYHEKVAAKVVSNKQRIYELFTPIKVSTPGFLETYHEPREGSLANHTLVSAHGYDKKTNQSLAEKWEEHKRTRMSHNDKKQEAFHALPQRIEHASLKVFVNDRAERMVSMIFSAQDSLRVNGDYSAKYRRTLSEGTTRKHYGVSILELVQHKYLNRGETLYLTNDSFVQATVTSGGTIRFEDETYHYLSPAASDAVGATRNGWQYWCVERGGQKVPLMDIRADYLNERPPRPL